MDQGKPGATLCDRGLFRAISTVQVQQSVLACLLIKTQSGSNTRGFCFSPLSTPEKCDWSHTAFSGLTKLR